MYEVQYLSFGLGIDTNIPNVHKTIVCLTTMKKLFLHSFHPGSKGGCAEF